MNPKSAPAAIQKELTELFFIEKFNWLPQDIQKIPYKWIQKYFIINQYKAAGMDMKNQLDQFKKEHQTVKSGQSKRFTIKR